MDSSDDQFLPHIPAFYPRALPCVGEYVVAKVSRVTNSGVYVSLLEYANAEAAIAIGELSRRGYQEANRLVWKGRQIVGLVMKVDRGCVDLSKKLVPADQVSRSEQIFSDNKRIFSIVKSVALKLAVHPIQIYQKIVYPLFTTDSTPLEALRRLTCEGEVQSASLLADVSRDWIEALELVIRIRLKLRPAKAQVEVVVSCIDGVDQVRAVLLAGAITRDYDRELKVTVKAAPVYLVTSTAPTEAEAITLINEALEKMRAKSESINATFATRQMKLT